MRIKTRYRAITAVLAAVAVMVVGFSTATTASAAPAKLSASQSASVIDAAKSIGLSDAQARSLSRDRKALETLPVKAELIVTEVLKTPTNDVVSSTTRTVRSENLKTGSALSPSAKGAAAQATNVSRDVSAAGGPWVNVPGCKRANSVLRYHNVFGVHLFDYNMVKDWCWDMHRVTWTPPAYRTIWISQSARFAYFFRGDIGSGQFGVVPVSGGFRGDQSWFQGHFDYCVARHGCIAALHPTVLVTGWFDGQYDTNAWV